MDQLTGLRVFREIVEGGSFTVAADRLGVSAPMVSKHVAQLERQLGSRLLNRSSRRISLTDAGEVYYTQVRHALDTLDAAESALGQDATRPRGQLKVSAPVWCANQDFATALAEYAKQFPEVVVDMRLENRRVDLVTEGFDLALRATWEPSPHLIAKPICPVQFFLVATPQHLKAVGPVNSIDDFERLRSIVPSYINLDKMTMTGPNGKIPVRMNPVLRSDDTTLTYHSVLANMGMAFLPDRLVAKDLAKKRLIRVLPQYSVPPTTLYAVYASRRYTTPKLRSFINFFCQRFAPDLTLSAQRQSQHL